MRYFTLSLYLIFLTFSCSDFKENKHIYDLSGKTMGTSYSIRIASPAPIPDSIHIGIDSVFIEINRQMSTWDKESEISVFNASDEKTPYEISQDFYQVLKISEGVWKQSKGAFDASISPLVAWWGFGSEAKSDYTKTVPDSIKVIIGFQMVDLSKKNSISKERKEIKLDLSAIAKGYAVDCAAEYIQKAGFSNFLIEVGGEIVVKGTKSAQKNWLIGVDRPSDNAIPGKNLNLVLALQDVALATSGDYRNYRMEKETRFSHIIDPRTFQPCSHNLASVTVISDKCAYADAMATALSVLGYEESIKLIESISGTEAYFINRTASGEFTEHFTSGFRQYVYNEGDNP